MISFKNYGAKGYMMVCIDDIICAKPAGTIFNYYVSGWGSLAGIENVVSGTNEICKTLNIPQTEFETRTLLAPNIKPGQKKMIKPLDEPCFCQHHGKLATILIIVVFRRNGSLQGETIVCGSKYQYHENFRCGMELMYVLREMCVRLGQRETKTAKNNERTDKEAKL